MKFFNLDRQTIIEPNLDEELDPKEELIHESLNQQFEKISHAPYIKNTQRSLKRQQDNLAGNKENKIYYNSDDFNKFMQSLIEENNNNQEQTYSVKQAKNVLISTVDSLHEFSKAAFRESKKINSRGWDETNKKTASQTSSRVINLVQLLGNDEEKLKKFWTNIYNPMALSGGYSQGELDAYTAGFMTELAIGYALKSGGNLSKNHEVYRATAAEDVEKGMDLIIVNKETGKEKSIQIKLLHGGKNDFIDIVKQLNPPEIRLIYGRTTDDLFNPTTAQPTPKLIKLVNESLLKEVI